MHKATFQNSKLSCTQIKNFGIYLKMEEKIGFALYRSKSSIVIVSKDVCAIYEAKQSNACTTYDWILISQNVGSK